MKTLIKNGTIITATDHYRGDVLIDDETISAIGSNIEPADVAADKVIDATDRYVIPGGIDVHTHLDMPFGGTVSADDFETGSIAAACGGTTTVVDFAIQDYGKTMREAWERWRHGERTASFPEGTWWMRVAYSVTCGLSPPAAATTATATSAGPPALPSPASCPRP